MTKFLSQEAVDEWYQSFLGILETAFWDVLFCPRRGSQPAKPIRSSTTLPDDLLISKVSLALSNDTNKNDRFNQIDEVAALEFFQELVDPDELLFNPDGQTLDTSDTKSLSIQPLKLFSIKAVKRALKSSKNNKSPGSDKIIIEIFKTNHRHSSL